jgi:competence protein ComEC
MRTPAPRPGQLWVNLLDVGAATAVVVSTTNHRLVFGTGESFGTRGQRFEARIARSLMVQSGRGGLDMLYIDSTSADQMRAVLAADALLDTAIVVRDPGRTGPPEIPGCAMRSWTWDAVDFQLQPTPSGKTCVLIVEASGGKMMLSTEFVAAEPADLVLLPRGAAAASESSIRHGLRKGGFAIASIDRRQWQAGRWRELRRILTAAGINLLATAEHGTMQFEIGNRQAGAVSPGIRSRTGIDLQPGIWSKQTRVNSCAVGL